MFANDFSGVEFAEGERVVETFKEKKGIFGLLSYWVVTRVDVIGRALCISVPLLTAKDKVYINGRKYKLEKK